MIYFKPLSAPIGAQIEITTACQNKCIHCYNSILRKDAVDVSMSYVELEAVIRALHCANMFSITLTGGEPLLFPELVVQGIKMCNKFQMSCSINTNLISLSEKTLLNMISAGHFNLLVSIASHDESTHDELMGNEGAFRKTLKSISLLNKHNIDFNVNMVITNINASQIYQTGVLAKKLGAKVFSATKATPPIGFDAFSSIIATKTQILQSLDDLNKLAVDKVIKPDVLECYPLCITDKIDLYPYLLNHRCSAGKTYLTISTNGDVRPCSHANRVYGNIFEDNICDIYERMDEWRDETYVPPICQKCEVVRICTTGCRCEAEYRGDIKAMDPFATGIFSGNMDSKSTKFRADFNFNLKVRVASDLNIRKEHFGYIIGRGNRYLTLDDEAGELISVLKNSSMTIKEISIYFNLKAEDICEVLEGLIVNNMANVY